MKLTTRIVLPLRQLHGAVKNVTPFAAKKNNLPVLQCVHFQGHGDHLTLAATDRYVLGVTRVKTTADAALCANVPVTALAEMLRAFTPGRDENPDIALVFDDATVTAEADTMIGDLLTGHLSWALTTGDYPNVGNILTKALTPDPVTTTTIALTPALLRRFAHLPGPIFAQPTGDQTPLIVQADNFIGAVASVRSSEPAPRDLTTNGWAPLLGQPTRRRKGKAAA